MAEQIIHLGIGPTANLTPFITTGLDIGEALPPEPAVIPYPPTTTIPTHHQSLALPVIVSDPLWWSDRAGYITTLFKELSSLSFSSTDAVGFDRASLPLKLGREEADSWLDGLGRHIVIKNTDLVVIWEGFVNLIKWRRGGKVRTIGPLIEMGNKVSGLYAPKDTSTSPPTVGERTSTGYLEDTDSQERYGTITQTLSLGETTSTLATRAITRFLNKKKNPASSNQEGFSGGDTDLTLECLGYYYLFDTYDYNDEEATGEQDLSSQLWDILSAYPLFSQVFSSADTSRFTTNTLQVPVQVDGSPRAKALIEELVSLGDASDNRYVFGVYAGRQIVYEPVVDEVSYIRRLSDRKQEIEDRTGGRIWPWDVQPGRWLRTPDDQPGQGQPASLGEDVRNTYLVSASFTAPYDVQLGGDEGEELPQMLAKIQRGINL